ncbi:hypothetical protein EXS70_02410 [Candidatus Peribacteria bacterium]|nr:hypothetical protein [Candidatus Peribacteria bacterium]
MPTSLLTAGSRAIQAGADIEFQDGNLRPLDLEHSDTVAVSLVGAPYIPEIRKQIGGRHRLILGGQVLNGLVQKWTEKGVAIDGRVLALQHESTQQFVRLFGMHAYNGNDDSEFAHALGIRPGDLPDVFHTSLIPAFEKLDDGVLRAYLSMEFSFFLSQGCKKDCSFCAAVRTSRDTAGVLRKVGEQYRHMNDGINDKLPNVVEQDLRWLTENAESFNLQSLTLYLSNLDLFQTPSKLEQFADIVLALKKAYPGFQFRMRGLCTTESFVGACKDEPAVVRKMVDAGLYMLGFGIDGDPHAEDVKASIHKKFNTSENCLNAIRLSREHGITPETLMVFGHEEDTQQTMTGAIRFAADMQDAYGAVPRPHLSKALIPGNDGWRDPLNAELVEMRLNNQDLFYNDDFTCRASSITHPDPLRRAQVNEAYEKMTRLERATTLPLFPREPADPELTALHEYLNTGKYDR